MLTDEAKSKQKTRERKKPIEPIWKFSSDKKKRGGKRRSWARTDANDWIEEEEEENE